MLHWTLVYLGVGPKKLYRQPHLLAAHTLVLKMRAIADGRVTAYAQLELEHVDRVLVAGGHIMSC